MLGNGSLGWLYENREEVITRLKKALIKDKRSMTEIAEAMGLTGKTIFNFMGDHHVPTIRTILKIENYIVAMERNNDAKINDDDCGDASLL